MTEIPSEHPRHDSLVTRHRIEEGVERGITSRQGLIAQGRGEAFDYLLGERTLESADEAARVAAAHLLLARHPVLSVNGNVAALCPEELVDLAEATGADLEINLFNRTDERVEAIADHLRDHGAREVTYRRQAPSSLAGTPLTPTRSPSSPTTSIGSAAPSRR